MIRFDPAVGITRIVWGRTSTPFGAAWVAMHRDRVLRLSFCGDDRRGFEQSLTASEPQAALHRDDRYIGEYAVRWFGDDEPAATVAVRGTPLRLRLWRTLCATRRGETVTYGELARRAGRPGAARAAGSAMAANPVAWLIPCHRVVPATGGVGAYTWGSARKAEMLSWERARAARRNHGPDKPERLF